MRYSLTASDPGRKIHFIKDLRSVNAVLGGGHLGLREAKRLADRAMEAGQPVIVEVPDFQAPMFAAYVNGLTGAACATAREPLSGEDVDYVRAASSSYIGFDSSRHDRVIGTLRSLWADDTGADLPYVQAVPDDLSDTRY